MQRSREEKANKLSSLNEKSEFIPQTKQIFCSDSNNEKNLK